MTSWLAGAQEKTIENSVVNMNQGKPTITTAMQTEHAPQLETLSEPHANSVYKRNYAAPERSRWGLELTAGSSHFTVDNWEPKRVIWYDTPVKYNQKNPGALLSYEVLSKPKYAVSATAGGMVTSLDNFSMTGGAKATAYVGETNRTFFDLEVGAITYKDKIEKTYSYDKGQKFIHPHGYGNNMIVPFYRLGVGFNVINEGPMRVGAKIAYTYKPDEKMNIVSYGIVLGLNKGHSRRSQNSSTGRAFYAANKNDAMTPPHNGTDTKNRNTYYQTVSATQNNVVIPQPY